MSAATIAGMASTLLFLGSMLPMAARAIRTRDMTSYSRGHLVLTNLGNLAHTVYVVSLPVGPVWALHSAHTGVAALMLVWHIRHAGASERPGSTVEREGIDHASEPTLNLRPLRRAQHARWQRCRRSEDAKWLAPALSEWHALDDAPGTDVACRGNWPCEPRVRSTSGSAIGSIGSSSCAGVPDGEKGTHLLHQSSDGRESTQS
jgi:hypothetical protein